MFLVREGTRSARWWFVTAAALTVEDLRVAARKLLSAFKVPTVWVVVPTPDAIPRGATGKVDVGRLRAVLAAAHGS